MGRSSFRSGTLPHAIPCGRWSPTNLMAGRSPATSGITGPRTQVAFVSQTGHRLARFAVLPLNNPPHRPRYDGSMEKGIRDFKVALIKRPQLKLNPLFPHDFVLAVRTHRSHRLTRRGPTSVLDQASAPIPCSIAAERLWPDIRILEEGQSPLTRPSRAAHCGILASPPRPDRCPPKPKVSTSFPQNWSHNNEPTVFRDALALLDPQERLIYRLSTSLSILGGAISGLFGSWLLARYYRNGAPRSGDWMLQNIAWSYFGVAVGGCSAQFIGLHLQRHKLRPYLRRVVEECGFDITKAIQSNRDSCPISLHPCQTHPSQCTERALRLANRRTAASSESYCP